MCSPHIHQQVLRRIEREGAPKLSRRNLLKFGGMAAAGFALTGSGLTVPRRASADMHSVIDLSHVFSPDVPTYGGTPGASRVDQVTVEADGFYIQDWTFAEHTGTHMDIPAHFIADGVTVDNYPVELFVSPAVVIDISAKAADDPDATLDVTDVEAWEAANGDIPTGALVCMYSGWESRWGSVEDFRNPDADGVMHFPGFSGEAAEFLVSERDIHGIAVDTLSLDPGPSATFDVHFSILGAGKYGVENVANLSQLMGMSASVVVGVPRWEAGSGGPCRVLAMVEAM
jgi:kynurenine formamidase